MEIGMIGLGRMGAIVTERLLQAGHRGVVDDMNCAAVERMAVLGAAGATSIEGLVRQLRPPRAIWLMVPAGDVVERTLAGLSSFLHKDDIIIDAGNSNYKDSI